MNMKLLMDCLNEAWFSLTALLDSGFASGNRMLCEAADRLTQCGFVKGGELFRSLNEELTQVRFKAGGTYERASGLFSDCTIYISYCQKMISMKQARENLCVSETKL